MYLNLRNLEDGMLVEGLTAKLISISQLCDQDLRVNFTRSEFIVMNKYQKEIFKGIRSSHNYYVWRSQPND